MKKLFILVVAAGYIVTGCGEGRTTHYDERHSSNEENINHDASDASIQNRMDSLTHYDTLKADDPVRGGERPGLQSSQGRTSEGTADSRIPHNDTSNSPSTNTGQSGNIK